MKNSIFGQIYSGPIVDNIDVADIITVESTSPATAVKPSLTGDAALDPGVLQRIEDRKDWFFGRDGAQPPITEEESEEIARQVDASRAEMSRIEAYIQSVQDKIEAQINNASVDGVEAAIILQTKQKLALKQALRRLFGNLQTRITLADLKELLAARSKLEHEAALDYAHDFPES